MGSQYVINQVLHYVILEWVVPCYKSKHQTDVISVKSNASKVHNKDTTVKSGDVIYLANHLLHQYRILV